ncbi:MAG TPA: PRC-barrel domain-containing protein [Candidatus Dormibacteraeota bacterium]|nr:PRC-barrel domain-containing protein [Candidatus Dormibacteraeota bacterium]
MFEDETPVAWTAVPKHVPVIGADGTEIGTAEALLGDEEEDIFHAVIVRRSGDGEEVEVPAARVRRMTRQHVLTDLNEDDAATLQPHR